MKALLSVILLLLANGSFAKNVIDDYQRIFLPVYNDENKLMIAIRVFKMNDIPSFLIVDPKTLKTNVMPIRLLSSRNSSKKRKNGYFMRKDVENTRYYQLLNKYTQAPYLLENQGVRHAANELTKGNILTIDLCPSSKSFETDFFNKLVVMSKMTNKPVPITIAISGLWLIKHTDEFQWLLSQKENKTLDITWANHSFSHIYYADVPYSKNFLLSPATNMEAEIFLTEKYLLEEEQIPSIFFRFPGLVSNKALIEQLKEYGLIPLATDAWLALLSDRQEAVTPGGIILVHGNSNEHAGIIKLLPLLNKLTLIDINESI